VRCRHHGIALLELIVALTILLIFGGMATAVYTNWRVWQLEDETADKLNALADAFCAHYDTVGQYATQLSDLAPYSSAIDVQHDAWGNAIAYYTNVNVDGADYAAAFVSAGKDGQIQSSLNGSTLTLSDQDIWHLVTEAMVNTTNRGVTAEKIDRANQALANYLATESSPDPACTTDNSEDCVLVLYSKGLLVGTDMYDEWGRNLILEADTDTFYSRGPDGIVGNGDDVT